ncbi:hypothetical protein EYF80_020081 [Liparis tanakae]|uniref:Uncharacterized protein n=1 Tax=Liparis tanakae TaxID=230148 RepID=A0A4Z2HVJ1_9TELE|nr:hypothetical protein EYF80_020081 [Liparis tanakae]
MLRWRCHREQIEMFWLRMSGMDADIHRPVIMHIRAISEGSSYTSECIRFTSHLLTTCFEDFRFSPLGVSKRQSGVIHSSEGCRFEFLQSAW